MPTGALSYFSTLISNTMKTEIYSDNAISTPWQFEEIKVSMSKSNLKNLPLPFTEKVTTSRQVNDIIQHLFNKDHAGQIEMYEFFGMICLKRNAMFTAYKWISEGGQSGTIADPKKIFQIALGYHAASIIIFHNHPSGNTQPSESDIKHTRKIKDGGTLLDLPVLDSLIVAPQLEDQTVQNYFSFADEGLI